MDVEYEMKSILKGLIICHFCGIDLSNTYWNVWVKEHNNKPIWAFVRLCAKCTMFERLKGEAIASEEFKIPK